MDSHSERDEDENQLGVISRGWKYPECSHGPNGERGPCCFSERAGAWVDPPWRALLGRVPYKTGAAPFCFMLPVRVSVKNADLCMQHNGGDPGVFVSAMEKP